MRYKGIKGKAWDKVKEYVRKKEKDCYTCKARNLSGYNAQAGHYLPVALVGSNNYLSWDIRQIHLQCGRCNGYGQGEQASYREHLIRDYGELTVKDFETRRYKVNPIKNWEAIIDGYQALIDAL